MKILKKIALIGLLFFPLIGSANQKTMIRLGVLAYGTVNWELNTLKQQGLLETEQYKLKIIPMASPQAGKVALLSGSVDMIVADWVWVSRQRSVGNDYSFYPYSNTTGALVVKNDSPVKQLSDLKKKKLAVAGGELDKNYLLLAAVMQKQGLTDVLNSLQKVYGAPPLLAHQLQQGRADALLTYWHYAARLESEGYRVLLTGSDLLQQLAVRQQVPSIGYVFNATWANQHKASVLAFLDKSKQMKNSLCSDDKTWQGIQTLTHAKTTQEDALLRQRYCAGRIDSWGKAEWLAAETIYQALKKASDNRLTGTVKTIFPGTFWGN